MPGTPTTAKQYLESLPDAQGKAVEAVRKVILKHLPKGYEESVGYGVLTYGIPLDVFPDPYNKQPLAIAAVPPDKYIKIYEASRSRKASR